MSILLEIFQNKKTRSAVKNAAGFIFLDMYFSRLYLPAFTVTKTF